MPKTNDELLKVSGFDKIRISNYGVDIVDIVKKHS
jgi:hypothetical protein